MQHHPDYTDTIVGAAAGSSFVFILALAVQISLRWRFQVFGSSDISQVRLVGFRQFRYLSGEVGGPLAVVISLKWGWRVFGDSDISQVSLAGFRWFRYFSSEFGGFSVIQIFLRWVWPVFGSSYNLSGEVGGFLYFRYLSVRLAGLRQFRYPSVKFGRFSAVRKSFRSRWWIFKFYLMSIDPWRILFAEMSSYMNSDIW